MTLCVFKYGFRTFELMLRLLLSYSFVLFYLTSNAQLISDSEGRNNVSFNQKTILYLSFDCLNSYRELTPNTSFLSTPLGERANEIPRWMSGTTLGVAIPVLSFFKINAGISYQQNGESYEWNSSISDSSFSYQTAFRYFAMPVQLSVEYGNRFALYGAFGMSPAIFNSYIQKSQWTTENASTNSEEVSIQDNCNSFIISMQGDLGIHYHINDRLGIQLSARYRKQLNNTYKEYEDYIHKAHAIGFSFAFSYKL